MLQRRRAIPSLHAGGPGRLQVGPGRAADELVRLLPGFYKDEKVGGDHIGFFVNRSGGVAGSQLGGQASRSSPTRPTERGARLHQMVRAAAVQKKWWSLGGYSAAKAVLNDPGSEDGALRRRLPHGDGRGRRFWAEPSYASSSSRAEARPRLRRRDRARPRRRSMPSSRTGRRSSRMTAS